MTGTEHPLHRVVLAGGGTAGHVEPALALADALRRRDPGVIVSFIGTATGLEATLVPSRGYELDLIDRVPLPRRITASLLTLPVRLRRAVAQARVILRQRQADVVVGFGGYVALPAYLAARGRVPIVIHEANARPGLANRLGARWAARSGQAVDGALPGADVVGIPVREQIRNLDRDAMRTQARAHFGLDPQQRTLLVMGGSQGAHRINEAVIDASTDIRAAGIQILHAVGPRNDAHLAAVQALTSSAVAHVAVPYLERMDLAYAAADVVLCRSGAMTCAEVSAVGLPAVFVPYAVGNGEQALNAAPLVAAGAAIVIEDAQLTADVVRERVVPLVADPVRCQAMSVAMRAAAIPDAAERLMVLVDDAVVAGRS